MELTVPEALKLAVSHHGAGRLDQAEELYRLILRAEPNNPEAMQIYGALLSQRGRHDEALDLIERAIKLEPNAAHYHANRGLVLFNMGLTDQAIEAYQKALALNPLVRNVHYNLGNAMLRNGQVDEAITYYRKAIELWPNDPTAYCNLGGAYLRQERLADAAAMFKRAVQVRPDYAEAMTNLGVTLARDKKLDEALEWYRRAAELRPQVPEVVNNYAGALKDAGRLDEALAWYRRAIVVNGSSLVHSNLVYLLHFHPDFDRQAIATELARWNEMHARPLAKDIQVHLNHSVPDKKLKIGYVSPFFYYQAEANFVLPLLACHDREKFEIHCFASVRKPDEYTEQHKKFADVWHDVSRDSDADLAKRIRGVPIDILVDLAMHLGENRLLAFARKPAPVQVTWLAYPGSTGLTAIDYRLTDSIMDPPKFDDSVYSERTIRLPGCWVCFDPLSIAEQRPLAQSLPVTFGSLNNPCKNNPKTLRIWAQVLRNVPDSRLLMLVVSESHRAQIRRLFDEAGVKPNRIEFVGTCSREEYLREYDRIDIGLDPLPYNGITTTCDALWMGVPVVTLTGLTAPSRAAGSVLTSAGLPELVANTPERFVQIAGDLGKDIPRLMEYRAGLRKKVLDSPLTDGPGFARAVETAYREMWEKWCVENSRK
jgi:predicted O-linked N-acetylglucosamine transferase (SPINDLY family)